MLKRSISVCSRSPKFSSESQNQNSRLFLSNCSTNSQISKSPYETVICSQEDIQGSSALLAAELDKLILINAGLTKEIGSWKRKYKECYTLVEQYLPLGKENQENSDYKQKYTKLKGKAVELKKGFKALESVLVDKSQEIGNWKQKYSQMEQEYIDQIQNLRNQIEIVLKTQIEKEVTLAFSTLEKEKTSKEEDWAALVSKLNQSQVELRFVSEEKEQALKKLQGMKDKLTQAESQNISLNSLQRELKCVNEEHEKALKQVDLVKEQLSAKEINCQSIQTKYTALNGEIERLRAYTKEQSTKYDIMQEELNCLNEDKEKVSKQLEQTRDQLKSAEKSYKEAQCKYILKSEEVDRLRSCEGEKGSRANKLQEELASSNRERERTQEQLEDMKAELIIAQDRSQKAQNRQSLLNTEVERLAELVNEKSVRLAELCGELETANEEKDRLVREIEEVKLQLILAEERNSRSEKVLEDSENEKALLKVEIGDLKALGEENIVEIKQLQEKLRLLIEEKEDVLEQLDKVRVELYQGKDSNEESQRVNAGLRTEAKKLKEMIEAKEKQVTSLQETVAFNENQLNVKTTELRSYQDKVLAQQEELQMLQDSVLQLNQELIASQASLDSSEGRMALYLQELTKRDEALESVKASLHTEVNQNGSQIAKLGAENNKISQERDALLEQIGVLSCLKDRVQEYEETLKLARKEKSELRSRLEAIANENAQALKNSGKSTEQYEKRIQALIERNSTLTAEVEELQFRVEKLSKEAQINGDLKGKLAQNEIFLYELTRTLGVEADNAINRIAEILKDMARLKQENSTLEAEKNVFQESCTNLEARLRELETSWEQVKASLDGEQDAEGMVKKIEGYKREIKRVNCEATVLKKRLEDQELRNIQEIDRIRCETESVWRKRMETEIESKNLNIKDKDEEMVKEKLENEKLFRSTELRLQNEVKKNEDYEQEVKALTQKNEQLNSRITQLIQEMDTMKLNFEEEKERESRLVTMKFELEKEKRVQQEKEFSATEGRLKEKASFHEEQAKTLKVKVEDFELRQVMFFIEIERLYAINGELIQDINRLTLELRDSSMEVEKNRRLIQEVTSRNETERSHQREQFGEVARDLTKQIEGFERKLHSHFTEKPQSDTLPLKIQDLAIETPIKKIDSFEDKGVKRGHYSSIHKSHAELRDLTMKFESEKKTMENQLVQLKKIVDMNKSEMKRLNQDNTHIRTASETLLMELSPSIKFGESQAFQEQPLQPYYREDIRPKSPFQRSYDPQFSSQITSAGKENMRHMTPLLSKSASQSALGFKNPAFQREEAPRVSVFKY